MGINHWVLGTLLFFGVEHPYIVRRNTWIWVSPPNFHAEKNNSMLLRFQQQAKVDVLAVAMQNTRENSTKHLIKGCSTQKQMISLSITSSER